MNEKFIWHEVVKVIEEMVVPKVGWQLKGETGFVTGYTESDDNGCRLVGVHFNTFGEGVAVPEEKLQSLGRIADPSEIITRSKLHQKRARMRLKPPDP